MTDPAHADDRRIDRGTVILAAALFTCAVVLTAVLVLLVSLGFRGLTVHVAGTVSLSTGNDSAEIRLAIDAPIPLTVAGEPVELVARGPDGGAIPAELSLGSCPGCGEPILPVRWNLWTGQIEWACVSCGDPGEDRRP